MYCHNCSLICGKKGEIEQNVYPKLLNLYNTPIVNFSVSSPKFWVSYAFDNGTKGVGNCLMESPTLAFDNSMIEENAITTMRGSVGQCNNHELIQKGPGGCDAPFCQLNCAAKTDE